MTEKIRVPVLSPSGERLMPTNSARARKWIACGKAKPVWNDLNIFCVQLLVEPSSTETAHANDGISLAASRFIEYKPLRTANSHGHHWVGSIQLNNAPFKIISRPQLYRRQLHFENPSHSFPALQRQGTSDRWSTWS